MTILVVFGKIQTFKRNLVFGKFMLTTTTVTVSQYLVFSGEILNMVSGCHLRKHGNIWKNCIIQPTNRRSKMLQITAVTVLEKWKADQDGRKKLGVFPLCASNITWQLNLKKLLCVAFQFVFK